MLEFPARRTISAGAESQRRVPKTAVLVVREISMNESRALVVAALFAWQLICPVAYAADDESGLRLGVRLPFGGAANEPVHLSLSMTSSDVKYGSVQSADIASLDFGVRGVPLDGKVLGLPIMRNGQFVLQAAEEPDSAEAKGVGAGTVILIGAAVLGGLYLIGQELFEDNAEDIVRSSTQQN